MEEQKKSLPFPFPLCNGGKLERGSGSGGGGGGAICCKLKPGGEYLSQSKEEVDAGEKVEEEPADGVVLDSREKEEQGDLNGSPGSSSAIDVASCLTTENFSLTRFHPLSLAGRWVSLPDIGTGGSTPPLSARRKISKSRSYISTFLRQSSAAASGSSMSAFQKSEVSAPSQTVEIGPWAPS